MAKDLEMRVLAMSKSIQAKRNEYDSYTFMIAQLQCNDLFIKSIIDRTAQLEQDFWFGAQFKNKNLA